MVFHISFVLALFHDNKCCNCINLFPCIYVGLIVRDECERLVKNQACNEDQCSFVTSSRVKVPVKRPRVKHITRT